MVEEVLGVVAREPTVDNIQLSRNNFGRSGLPVLVRRGYKHVGHTGLDSGLEGESAPNLYGVLK